jgi:hypothetical protein
LNCNWGGAAERAARFDIFCGEITGGIRSCGTASDNDPTRGRLREGCPYMIEGEGGRFGSTKQKHIIVHCGLHDVVQSGGQN